MNRCDICGKVLKKEIQNVCTKCGNIRLRTALKIGLVEIKKWKQDNV